jgi:hypothetical protein
MNRSRSMLVSMSDWIKPRLVVIILFVICTLFFLPVIRRHQTTCSGTFQCAYSVLTPVSSSWITEFKSHERQIYSQNGEDGVLLWIFANIGTIHRPPRFVEFGVENGQQCNTRFLREQLGWQGLMMDGSNSNPNISLHREIITAQNINELLAKHQTPSALDLLSIDVE